MKELNTTPSIESSLAKLGAVRWNNEEQVLYDYPSKHANPYFHFAFDTATEVNEATRVAVTLVGRGENFRVEKDHVQDIHFTALGVFSMEGFAKFLEVMMLADIQK